MSTGRDKGAEQPAPDDQAEALAEDIEQIRGRLGGMVSELDHRRHDLFDLRKQLRRHAVPLVLTGLALLGLAAGGTALAARRRRQRETLGARSRRLRQALARMIDKPERVASAPSPERKIATAAAAALASVVVKRLAERVGKGARPSRARQS
jgi:hypothetical protein